MNQANTGLKWLAVFLTCIGGLGLLQSCNQNSIPETSPSTDVALVGPPNAVLTRIATHNPHGGPPGQEISTPTDTPVPSNTPGVDPSNTPRTNTPTATSTQTFTPSVTPSFTPSATPAQSSTACAGLCSGPPITTPVPTFTPSGNSLSFTLNYDGYGYDGYGTVDASHKLVVELNGSIDINHSIYYGVREVPTNNSPLTFTDVGAGEYGMSLIYAASGLPYPAPAVGYVGDGYNSYYIGGAEAIFKVNGATNLGQVYFNGDNGFLGVYGNVTYTGAGAVDYCHPIYVLSYHDAAYTQPFLNSGRITANGVRYDNTQVSRGLWTAYLRAFYDVNDSNDASCPCVAGNGGAAPSSGPCPHAGDPYINLGSYVAGTTATNITFGSSTW